MNIEQRLRSLYQAFNHVLSDGRVVHVYELRDGLILRKDIEESE
jgi:hypothetical protein